MKESKLENSPLPLLVLQNSINQIREHVLPELRDAIDYPVAAKVEDLKLLLVETKIFDKNVDELRNEFEALKTLMDQLDKNDLIAKESGEIIEAEMSVYRGIVEQIAQKNFNRTASNCFFIYYWLMSCKVIEKQSSKLQYRFQLVMEQFDIKNFFSE